MSEINELGRHRFILNVYQKEQKDILSFNALSDYLFFLKAKASTLERKRQMS